MTAIIAIFRIVKEKRKKLFAYQLKYDAIIYTFTLYMKNERKKTRNIFLILFYFENIQTFGKNRTQLFNTNSPCAWAQRHNHRAPGPKAFRSISPNPLPSVMPSMFPAHPDRCMCPAAG